MGHIEVWPVLVEVQINHPVSLLRARPPARPHDKQEASPGQCLNETECSAPLRGAHRMWHGTQTRQVASEPLSLAVSSRPALTWAWMKNVSPPLVVRKSGAG